jgi:hypothetical protein
MEISDVMQPALGAEAPIAEAPQQKEWPSGVEPDDPPRAPRELPAHTAPRGRPWVKGESGNPAGRPPKRAHAAHYVARSLIGRKAALLTGKQIDMALAGDRTMLRLCQQSIMPPRREAPIDLQLPPITERSDLKAMMIAVADAAARGTITSAQAGALVRMLAAILEWTR